MPEQSYPPPPDDTGALTMPRQLNRWLDKNPQNGPLRRIRKYFVFPVFEIADRWDGYSDIVTAFNYEAAQNFSIRPGYVVPDAPNYTLCISYRVGGTVTRYLLWDASGSNLNMDIPAYTGQPILKNFRLEVWNTSQGASSSTTQVTFNSSVLGPYDYRYQTDMALVTADAQVLDFWADSYTGSNIIPPGATWELQFPSFDARYYWLAVTPGFSYNFFLIGDPSFVIYKTATYDLESPLTVLANSGMPNFVGSESQPYVLLTTLAAGAPLIGDLVAQVVNDVTNINPFFVPIVFPDNAVSVTN